MTSYLYAEDLALPASLSSESAKAQKRLKWNWGGELFPEAEIEKVGCSRDRLWW